MKIKKRYKILAAFPIFAIAFMGLINYGIAKDLNFELDENSFSNQYLTKITRTGIKLPNGSRGLRLYCHEWGFKTYIIAKVEIPGNSAETLITQLKQLYETEKLCSIMYFTEKVSWWNPPLDSILFRRQYRSYNIHTQVWVCKENEKTMLYLINTIRPSSGANEL
ncbi:hypothetical protein LLG95_15205 [bacterium]|nr:hypothetical protein [bacterium]